MAKLVSGNRFTPPYQTPHVVVQSTPLYSLRHYGPAESQPASEPATPPQRTGATVLLVPPLMVTAEVYDMAPELSLLLWLCERGHDVWLIDFRGEPGDEKAHEKDLADHILSVSAALDEVTRLLADLRSAWAQIQNNGGGETRPAAARPNGASAYGTEGGPRLTVTA